jgi:dihydrofolate synthase / folylpolyglutamate synthase
MRRLCSLLGFPQNQFASIHVVGTNGKTSVAAMTAALLEAHGVSAGAYLSPHVLSWRERIVVGGEAISEAAFADSIERCRKAAEVADRSADGDEGPITQFELVTAAAFVAFASARVQYAVVEAGLGGRLDATNVIPSKLTILTSVGLDHTEWLGETLEEIAAEKLAVLRDHTTLIRGEVPAEVERVIERQVKHRHAKQLSGPSSFDVARSREGTTPLAGYQRRNMALAERAVEEALGHYDDDAVSQVVEGLTIPGRAELVPGDPPLIFDAAHNAEGARALAQSLPELAGGAPVVACLAVLAEKDAAAICKALAPACAKAVCTEFPIDAVRGSGRPAGEATPVGVLADLWRAAGGEAEAIADPLTAWSRARELAAALGGSALAAGSHYLLRSLWTRKHAESF